MTIHDLYRTPLQHLYTEVLEAPKNGQSPRCMGFTEWSGERGGRIVSLGWDWVRLDDGALIESFDCAIRSNMMMLDAKGYDLGIEQAELLLREHIRAAVDWKKAVAAALLVTTPRDAALCGLSSTSFAASLN